MAPLHFRLTTINQYGILYPRSYWAASSMAEQETLNFKVQGSTPWQPTSHTISPKRYPILPQIFRAGANVSRLLSAICKITLNLEVRAFEKPSSLAFLPPKWYYINKDFINLCLYN
jgi:hypothetical protein